jgi:hypothetical protein
MSTGRIIITPAAEKTGKKQLMLVDPASYPYLKAVEEIDS